MYNNNLENVWYFVFVFPNKTYVAFKGLLKLILKNKMDFWLLWSELMFKKWEKNKLWLHFCESWRF